LKIKYESLIQRKQGSSSTNVNEHSQAYYMIRAAQEKEELQRKEDELKAKILKNEKELKALVNTLSHLKNRNSNYRDYFINKGATQKDVELKNHLDEQCKVAADNLMKKKKEFEKMKKECDEIANRIGEMNNKVTFAISPTKISIERNSGCPKKDCHRFNRQIHSGAE
jgi:thiamine kinase-like enzyme